MERWSTATIASRSFAIAVWMWIRCRARSSRKTPLRTRHNCDSSERDDVMRTELYWIEGPWLGRLAIMPRPRGADWLEEEIQSWRQSGVEVIVSLLTREEQTELSLADEAELCRANGIEFVSFPIVDRGIPSSFEAFSNLVIEIAEQLTNGKNVAIHCRQGIGRAALVAICMLILVGIESAAATERVSSARRCSVPETAEQRRWIADFAKSLVTGLSR